MDTHLDPVADKDHYLPYYPAPEPGPRPLADVLADLRRPIHPNFLRTKQKKGNDITFIEWHTALRILDRYAFGFHYRTRTGISLDGQHVTVDAEIGIPSSDYGVTWRGSTGSDEDEDKAYGDATDRAESQALRRAAAKFGLGLALYYDKDARIGRPAKQAPGRAVVAATTQQPAQAAPVTEGDRERVASVAAHAQPVAATGSTASEKQIAAIKIIARSARHWSEAQVVEEARRVFGKGLTELNRAEASQFIDLLKAA